MADGRMEADGYGALKGYASRSYIISVQLLVQYVNKIYPNPSSLVKVPSLAPMQQLRHRFRCVRKKNDR